MPTYTDALQLTEVSCSPTTSGALLQNELSSNPRFQVGRVIRVCAGQPSPQTFALRYVIRRVRHLFTEDDTGVVFYSYTLFLEQL